MAIPGNMGLRAFFRLEETKQLYNYVGEGDCGHHCDVCSRAFTTCAVYTHSSGN